jgi:hypothetical protein
VDPRRSEVVYLAWADGTSAADYTIHLRRSTDSGQTWSADLRAVVPATNPQLAINEFGEVGFFYQKLHNPGSGNRWQTHVEISDNAFSTHHDILLADLPDDNGTGPTLNPSNPLGDYAGLVAVGDNFYGVFCGNNTPDLANFPHGVVYQRNANFSTHQLLDLSGINPVIASYDPFFFHIRRHEKERKDLGGFGVARLEIEGLKYEKLEIKALKLDFEDPRSERRRRSHGHAKDHHEEKHGGVLRQLGEEIEELGRRLASASRDDEDNCH